jgi:hypothetical protein
VGWPNHSENLMTAHGRTPQQGRQSLDR